MWSLGSDICRRSITRCLGISLGKQKPRYCAKIWGCKRQGAMLHSNPECSTPPQSIIRGRYGGVHNILVSQTYGTTLMYTLRMI